MRNFHVAASLPIAMLLSAPAAAQSLAELDRLSDLTANEDTGVAAAQEQAGRGAYLEALSTLERVMAAYPESVSARLLHAVYLCRIDDRQGGLVEISQMDEDLFGAANIADARDRCSRPYVEPQPPTPAPAPVARPDPEPIETVALPPSTAAGGTVSGKEQPAPVAPPPAAPVTTASGTNAISGSNSISGSSTPSSSSSSSQQPEDTSGGEKD